MNAAKPRSVAYRIEQALLKLPHGEMFILADFAKGLNYRNQQVANHLKRHEGTLITRVKCSTYVRV